MPKFARLWVDCTQEEMRIAARQRLHGTQPEENQAFMAHAKEGKGKGRNFHHHKHHGRRPSPSLDQQEKKKDLSQMQCFKYKKYGYYANKCPSSSKRKHEASTSNVVKIIT